MKYIDLLRLREDKFKYFTVKESLMAVREDGENLKFVKYQTDEICLEAVKQIAWTRYIYSQLPYELYLPSQLGLLHCWLGSDTEKTPEDRFKYFTEEESLKAVRENGCNLRHVKYQTDEICLEAIKYNGMILGYVDQQTEEICLEAYKQSPDSILYIRESIEEFRKRRLNDIQTL